MKGVVIGLETSDHIRIDVVGRGYPTREDYWDGNWLHARIVASAGGFTADFPAFLRADEFRDFRDQLERVYETLKGSAVLESLEPWIKLRISVDDGGRLAVGGTVVDAPGTGNRLEFHLDGLDQTHLPPMIASLAAIERDFPVRGRPDQAD